MPDTDVFVDTPVEELREGDVIDLEADDYADPWGNKEPSFEFEYAEIESIDRYEHTVVLHTTLGSWGFPLGWLIKCRLIEPSSATAGDDTP